MSFQTEKPKKYSWIVVTAMIVGAIVGSGIVVHSVSWAATGGSYALYGLILVWAVFLIIGIAMVDNVSMMPEKGGVYAWSRKTMGRFWGNQIGWIYLVGFTCLSAILSWLAYQNTLKAILYFYPGEEALLAGVIFSIIIPMIFIALFTIVIGMGKKSTTQLIVGFFTIKVTMWLTIVGISLLHFEPSVAKNTPDIDPLWATLSVGLLCLFAMNGIDAVSVISEDIHQPGKKFGKGLIIGMLIVLVLYLSTVVVIMGLVGQEGAKEAGGLADIFLQSLSVPPPVLLVFIVISIVGTLFINMYMVIRLSGAMSENNDFFFGKHARKLLNQENTTKPHKTEIPLRGIVISTLVYAIFFILIFVENSIDSDTSFVLYCIDKLALWPFLVILFFIAFTNFKAHRMGLGKIRREEKKEFKWAKGYVIPILGMVSIAFIIVLSVYTEWTNPSDMLPSAEESYAWQFWQILGLVFPAFMIVPGLLYWVFKGRKKSLLVEPIEGEEKQPISEEPKKKGKKEKVNKKKVKKKKGKTEEDIKKIKNNEDVK